MTVDSGANEQQWIYEPTADHSARFVLGTVGDNPLVCFGINPSTAVPGRPDATVRRVKRFAADNGYDSWTMMNVYPQIATNPRDLHHQYLPELKAQNEQHIARLLDSRPLTLLAAWGGLIRKRPYLPTLLRGILTVTASAGCRWLSIGEPLLHGHPRHPLRAPAALPLQPFDMDDYLRRIG